MDELMVDTSVEADIHAIELGCTILDEKVIIRVHCPRSPEVEIELFKKFDDKKGERMSMIKKSHGVWEVVLSKSYMNWYYGFWITPPNDNRPFLKSNTLIADPYSKYLSVENDYFQKAKSIILQEETYDWENDTYISVSDPRDLIIYETHLKDMVALCDQGESISVIEAFMHDKTGGIAHLKKLGVNAVELLPIQLYSYLEPPFESEVDSGVRNHWNRYETNHWGYMTSYFFSPEPRFCSPFINGKERSSTTATHVNFKDLVKSLHKNGIAVILDIVVNHVSQYDLNPFKYLDKEHYFRLDSNGEFLNRSGCGNDFKTESAFSRKLILDVVKYWIKEFHVDGFRFDLAHLIDTKTLQEIHSVAKEINPGTLLIAEPWGGGYNPTLFSELGWIAWNDQIRNGIKGSDPVHDSGFIFGSWQHESSRLAIENYFSGTLLDKPNGRFLSSTHSLNYLESHDGYTLGDFIRIGLDHTKKHLNFSENKPVKLDSKQTRLNKLAALSLFCSQGITMIHEGQEWARTKVITDEKNIDPNKGILDHNSYEKDDPTNYLNFNDIEINKDLFEYYQGLIAIRKMSPALRKSDPSALTFSRYDDSLHITFHIDGKSVNDKYNYLISINTNPHNQQFLHLPPGFWELLVSGRVASSTSIVQLGGIIKIEPSTGILLRKLREPV